ncbi:hypothetical protein JL720_7785 [Aureococcus anophagefferens]|nr:hypothetical protein JL720_7785 [Aureococcus anophagefferens]
MKRGLVDVCSEAAALYVWDQCVLSSFDGVLPAAAAALLLCVRDAVLFRVARLEAGEDAGDAARGALEAVARDASAGDLEAQRARALAPSLPSVLLDAALPGALDAAPVPDDAPHSLADGAAFVPSSPPHVAADVDGAALALDWAEKATLPHLVYSAYNALRVKHDLAVVAAAQHRDIVAAEEAIAAAKRAEARRAAGAAALGGRGRGAARATRGPRPRPRRSAPRARRARRSARPPRRRPPGARAAFLACVAEAKARATRAAARAKYDAAEADRDRVIRDAVAAVQSVYRHTYAPADVAALDAKAEGRAGTAPRPPLMPVNVAHWAPSASVSRRVRPRRDAKAAAAADVAGRARRRGPRRRGRARGGAR